MIPPGHQIAERDFPGCFPGCFSCSFSLFQRLFCHLLVQARPGSGLGVGRGQAWPRAPWGTVLCTGARVWGPNRQELGHPPPRGVSAPESGGGCVEGAEAGWRGGLGPHAGATTAPLDELDRGYKHGSVHASWLPGSLPSHGSAVTPDPQAPSPIRPP